MMVERYPNLKEEVGGLNPGCEISSTWWQNLPGGQLPPMLWRWRVGLLSQNKQPFWHKWVPYKMVYTALRCLVLHVQQHHLSYFEANHTLVINHFAISITSWHLIFKWPDENLGYEYGLVLIRRYGNLWCIDVDIVLNMWKLWKVCLLWVHFLPMLHRLWYLVSRLLFAKGLN